MEIYVKYAMKMYKYTGIHNRTHFLHVKQTIIFVVKLKHKIKSLRTRQYKE